MTFAGKRVLITGATGGLGIAISEAFAQSGAELVLTGRRADVLMPLANRFGAQSLVADLAVRDDVRRLVAESGHVDIFVANAALPASGHISKLSQEQIDTMLEVNLRAPVAIARALTEQMTLRGSGHMVFISSLAGKAASPSSSLYSATKFGLRGFALGLRQDLDASGVWVSLVLPGFISDAGMFADSGAKLPPGVGTRTPGNVAEAVLWAVERNRAEVTVAPLGLRIGAELASLAPALAARFQKLAGGEKLADEISTGQLGKRP